MKAIYSSSRLRSLGFAIALAAAGVSSAHAGSIVCGDPDLGLRITTVDPAAACTYAGLQNLGDPELVALLDSLLPESDDPIVLLDRDTTNNNGGLLNITGVNLSTGSWTIAPSVWAANRVFLWFHFGDANDNPSPTSTTDPDTFIVELARADLTGSWTFGGSGGADVSLTGLSNIGLLGAGKYEDGGGGGEGSAPEPASLLLLGAGLLGLGASRRRKAA
jgi:hypothetical protein